MTVDVYETLRQEALARIDGTGLDPADDAEEVRSLLQETVEAYQQKAHLGAGRSLADPKATVDRLVMSVTGKGPLAQLLDRDDVEEIFIEGDRITYLEAGGSLRSAAVPSTEAEDRLAVEQLIASTDRRLDASNPIAQARILDGTARLSAVIPPVGDRLSATIRRYALRRQTLDSLVDLGSITSSAAAFLTAAMAANALDASIVQTQIEAIEVKLAGVVSLLRYGASEVAGWPVGTAQVVDVLRQVALHASAETDPLSHLDLALSDLIVPQMGDLTSTQLDFFEEAFTNGGDHADLSRTRKALAQLREAQHTSFA